jgi:predicted MPP superfamily phosphohydrolase
MRALAHRQTRLRPFRASGFALTETALELPGLHPLHDGLRVAQLSDIRRIPELLGGIEAPTFAVLGNHDHWVEPIRVANALERCGYTVLQNEHILVDVRGAPAALIGIDDGLTRRDDVDAAFDGAPSAGTRLVLAHTPPTVEKLPPHAGLVQFSGHTHGGQVMVPGVTRAIFRLAGQPYVRGLYRVRGNLLYVNRGLGFGAGGPLLRLGSHPEVAFFTLRRDDPFRAQ